MYSALSGKLLYAVSEDLRHMYENLPSVSRESLYWYVLSSNPKLFPISGFQHFLGSGFVALRLAEFLGLSDYDSVAAFLGGVFHDFNKWYVSTEDIKNDVYRKLGETQMFKVLGEVVGEKLERAFLDAIEVGLKLESGGLPRNLQRVAELVRAGDILTGSRESWSLTYCIKTLLSVPGIKPENVLPVIMGRQRPFVSLVSEVILSELEKQGAIPLVSTPEGMLLLVSKDVSVEDVYKAVADYIVTLGESEKPSAEVRVKGKGEKAIDLDPIRRFLHGKVKDLSAFSGLYRTISMYSPETVENIYRVSLSSGLEEVRYFVVALANIYRKRVRSDEKEEERLATFVRALQLPAEQERRVLRGKNKGEMLKSLYSVLLELGAEELAKVAERAKEFVISEMKRFSEISADVLLSKLRSYISIGFTRPGKEAGEAETSTGKVCGICREPVVVERMLKTFLEKYSGRAVKGKMSTSEVFHPDIQGKPEKAESIEDAKYYPVCELCYFEAEVAPIKLGYMDGNWAAVLQYYPAIPVDLIKVVKGSIRELHLREVTVIPDYMTSRVIAGATSTALTKYFMLEALNLWCIFGGNLVLTTTALSPAFTAAPLPVALEVSDTVIEEATSEYMRVLDEAKRSGRYLAFTRDMRWWLYKTLRDYIANLEEKGGARTTSVMMSRSGALVTGFVSVDVYSFVLKQSEKTERKKRGWGI